ncbi:MAG TPA: SRPBCC domain-containing protein [Vicinamibacteria bacterium]|nr:SRPBCC domain-containing protein [Vicinamibacteria bacterium]
MKDALEHSLERTVLIRARRETVFRYFTDNARFARWWGEGSTVEARRGGAVRIRYPNGVMAGGEMLEVVENERVAFTYGFESGNPMPVGASRVTVTLEDHREGTLVRLRHDLADAAARDAHVQGWRYQMAVFATVVAAEQHAAVAALVDRFLAAWSEPDQARRRATLEEIATPDLTFRDQYSCTAGVDDLDPHLAAAQRFMPGLVLRREGEVGQCQGTAVARWVATGPDGAPRGSGIDVFELAPDGRLARVVGLWGA